MPGEVQGVTMCCDCWGGGQCVCVCGREQMPAMRRGVSAHFDCSARTDRWAGGAQVGVSVGCGGLWVMPDFSALYAPHVFILQMLQTSAPLPTSYCVSVFFYAYSTCIVCLKSFLTYILQFELDWAFKCTVEALCKCKSSDGIRTAPYTLSGLFSRVSTTKSLCMCVRMHDKTAPDNILILRGVPE